MIEAIADEFERWLSHMIAVACSARRHPEAWQAIRRAWLPGAPAAASYLGEAAHPSEFREVLVALHAAYAARLPPEAPGESEAMWDFRRRRLPDFVRTETSAYIARVTPQPDIGSLFAQAAAAADRRQPPLPAFRRGRWRPTPHRRSRFAPAACAEPREKQTPSTGAAPSAERPSSRTRD